MTGFLSGGRVRAKPRAPDAAFRASYRLSNFLDFSKKHIYRG
jgi:hypothetical protein